MVFWKDRFYRTPLKLRVTVVFALLFSIGGGAAFFFLSASQRSAMERLLSDHQYTLTVAVAEEIERRLSIQAVAMERVAATIPPEALSSAGGLAALIASRAGVVSFFSGGIAVARPDGTVVGEHPALGRTGRNVAGLPSFREALAGGAPLYSPPFFSDILQEPAVAMWVPLKDGGGHIHGVMFGVTRLTDGRFVNDLTSRTLGEGGGFYIVDERSRVFVSSYDRTRIFTPIPATGVNRMLDRFLAGYQGSGRTVNSRGIDALVSGHRIPSAGWLLVASLPVADAFLPVERMWLRMAVIFAAFVLLSLAFLWVVLDRALRPLARATAVIRDTVQGHRPLGPLEGGGGEEAGALITGFNHLLRKVIDTEAGLRRSLARQEAILANTPIGLAIVGPDRRLLEVNDAFTALFGQGRDTLVGHCASALYGSADSFLDIGRRAYPAMAAGAVFRDVVGMQRGDGSVLRVRLAGRIIDRDDPDLGSIWAAEDITEALERERALKESEERHRAMVDGVHDYAIFRLTPEGCVASWNAGAERINGYRADEILGCHIARLHRPVGRTQGAAVPYLEVARATGRAEDEGWHVRKDGTLFWANVVLTALRDEAGTLTGFVAIARDLTERRRAGLEIRRLSAFQASILAATGSAIIVTGRDGRITLFNRAAEQLLLYAAGEVIGVLTPEVFHDPGEVRERAGRLGLAEEPGRFQELVRRLAGDAAEEGGDEWTMLRKDGTRVPVQLLIRPLDDEDGDTIGFIHSAQGISAFKQLEAELKRSNGELERFAYAASHDLRQPLRVVAGHCALLERQTAGRLDEEAGQSMHFIRDGIERMDRMLVSLLDYSRVGRMGEPMAPVALRRLLDEALADLKPDIEESGAVVTVDGDWPVVEVSRNEVVRLFMNLVGNAVKYRAAGRPPVVAVEARAGEGGWVVTVRDNGIGIAPAQFHRLFTVFQRLVPRSVCDGTGVGLAICRKIVERHGGRIWVESDGPGTGCAFRFTMPAAQTAHQTAQTAAAPAGAAR